MYKSISTTCKLILLFVIILLSLLGPGQSNSRDSEAIPEGTPLASAGDFNQHCTVFYAGDGQVALGGNNEDSFNPRTKIWFLPPEERKYGVAILGYEDYVPQGAVNDHGVFFDGLAVKIVQVPEEKGKPAYPGGANALMIHALQECETVDCVLNMFARYSRGPGTWNGQYLVGDSKGDSAIIEPLAVIRKQGNFQVATNFFQSEVMPEDRNDYRYTKATSMFRREGSLSVDLFRRTLDATHQEGTAHTLYSTIYDLKRGLIYIYYFHDFDHVVVMNLEEELAKGLHDYDIPELFPPSEAALAFGKPTADQIAQLQTQQMRGMVSPGLLARYVGKYEFQGQNYLLVKAEGDKLLASGALIPWVEMYPETENRFFRTLSDGDGNVGQIRVTFLPDYTGRVTKLEYTDTSGNRNIANKVEAQAFPFVWFGPLAVLIILAAPAGWYAFLKLKGQLT